MYNVFHKLELIKKQKKYHKIFIEVKNIINENKYKKEEELLLLLETENNYIFQLAYITLLVNLIYKIDVYDEQILGAIALYKHNVLDMKTGEGKTIVALMSSILHVLNKSKVHIITANEYLVNRDYNYGIKILDKLNIKTAMLTEKMRFAEKREPYTSDIVYGTAKTFCFDYLNDSLVKDIDKRIFKNLDVAIIDEIDFILIEEARSPISISGKDDDEGLNILVELNDYINEFILNVDFIIDDKTKNIEFNDEGFKKFESLLVKINFIKNNKDLYTYENTKYLQFFYQTIKAHYVLKKDFDYVVLDNKIVIVDENTGRLITGKTWNNGLHQALEIKEGLEIHKDSKTLATTSLQGFFSKYKNISGMSGTSKDDEIEFKEIYSLDVIEIPTHKKSNRKIIEDIIFSEKQYALKFLLDDVLKNHTLGRPILIGTTNIKDSELIYEALKKENIVCEILNAKNNEKESLLIESAGKFGNITISTNMAGRGTDIMLGGNRDTEIQSLMDINNISYDEAFHIWKKENIKINELGGLYVIGFSRASSKKLDNQLLGRCARQGDNGSCRFYLTLEDELLNVFGKAAKLLWNTITMGVKDVGISDSRINKNILDAQRKSENFLFNYRKSMLRYSQISEKQFEIINEFRNSVLKKSDFKPFMDFVSREVFSYIKDEHKEKGITDFYDESIKDIIYEYTKIDKSNFDGFNSIDAIENQFVSLVNNKYFEKLNYFENKNAFEKNIIVEIIDNYWIEHLTALENIKKGTSFRNVAQKNPFDEFKNESFKFFDFLMKQIFIDILKTIINIDPIDLLRNLEDNKQNFEMNNVNYIFLGKVKNYGF